MRQLTALQAPRFSHPVFGAVEAAASKVGESGRQGKNMYMVYQKNVAENRLHFCCSPNDVSMGYCWHIPHVACKVGTHANAWLL